MTAVFVGLLACLVALFSLVLPISSAGRPAARQMICTDNLKQIALALESYHGTHGCYPPTVLTDGSGKPMHSWRVLILKEIAPDIYAAYDFSEPWDGPNNSKLAAKIPPIFSCPNDSANRDIHTFYTNYVAVVGPATAFSRDSPTQHDDIRRTRDETILAAETTGSRIHWMEPRDLDSTRISFSFNDSSRPSISSHDPRGPGLLLADGTVRRYRQPISPEVLKAMTRIAGQFK